jgi:mRNA interferase MazF
MSAKYKIVLVPFPFDDLTATKVRPALCLTNELSSFNQIVIAFISSKVPLVLNSTDVLINTENEGFTQTGLKINSVIILHKIVTISYSIIIKEMGFLPESFQPKINNKLKLIFNL